jgi:molybdate transport system substrate-binding protein
MSLHRRILGRAVGGVTRRAGRLEPLTVLALGSLTLLIVLVGFLVRTPATVAPQTVAPSPQAPAAPLLVYCAASNRGVLEAIRRDYEAATGERIDVQYGASQTLLAGLEVTRIGDLYLPADETYLLPAKTNGLVAAEYPLAAMGLVVAVPEGNPRGIRTWDDLLRPEVRLALGEPGATASGAVVKASLRERGLWEPFAALITVYKGTVNDVANDVVLGAVDAGVVYDVVLKNYPTLEGVTLPELAALESRVTLAVLTTSRDPARARRFAEFVGDPARGLRRYREFGFRVPTGAPSAP